MLKTNNIILIISIVLTIIFLIYCFFVNSTIKVPVLMYHDVIDSESLKQYSDKNKKISISIDKFEQQMKFLKENNYKVLTLDEFYGFMLGTKTLPKRCVLITFDDGRKNIFINAYPILKKYNFSAVAFIITSKINDKTEEHKPLEWQYLSKDELEKGKDVFEYASHTHNMHRRDKSSNKSYLVYKPISEVKNDIQISLNNVDNKFFAYPFGVYNDDVKNIMKELGVKAAFTTKKGKVSSKDSIYELKRNGIGEHISEGRFKRIIGYKPDIRKEIISKIQWICAKLKTR